MGLEIVELVKRIEEEFGISIPDEDAARFTTLGDMEEYLAARLQTAPEERAALWARLQVAVGEETAIPMRLLRRESRIVHDLGLD